MQESKYEWTAPNGRGPKDIKFVPEWAQKKPILTPEFINGLSQEELFLLQYEWGLLRQGKATDTHL